MWSVKLAMKMWVQVEKTVLSPVPEFGLHFWKYYGWPKLGPDSDWTGLQIPFSTGQTEEQSYWTPETSGCTCHRAEDKNNCMLQDLVSCSVDRLFQQCIHLADSNSMVQLCQVRRSHTVLPVGRIGSHTQGSLPTCTRMIPTGRIRWITVRAFQIVRTKP